MDIFFVKGHVQRHLNNSLKNKQFDNDIAARNLDTKFATD